MNNGQEYANEVVTRMSQAQRMGHRIKQITLSQHVADAIWSYSLPERMPGETMEEYAEACPPRPGMAEATLFGVPVTTVPDIDLETELAETNVAGGVAS